MNRLARVVLLVAALGLAATAAAQGPGVPNGAFLVAKPGLPDPNFNRTVVLVTRAPGGGNVGVIVNRPTKLKLSQLLPRGLSGRGYHDKVFFGGPVMLRAIVAAVASHRAPKRFSFRVLDDVYLTMRADDIRALLAGHGKRYRLYVGYSSWAPGQLAREVSDGSWYVLPADQATIFSSDTAGLWRELVDRASAKQVRATRRGARDTAPAL